MPEPDPAQVFVARLNALGVPWMATGAIAAMTYGEYRVTNDLDVVIMFGSSAIDRLPMVFPDEEFYRPPRDVLQVEAGREQRGHFNLIHFDSGFKADIYLAAGDPLDRWGFAHRQMVEAAGGTMWLAPPEYVIIRKLEFHREGGSEKHIRDINGMLRITSGIDTAIIVREVNARGLQESWRLCQPSSPPA